ncbi:MAG TPA: hypothetical protein VJS11_01875 [Acidobacteriaceae bacterium]|nr:hypothetical protein [Acidobacteriaceae bacterium]
MKGRRSTLLIAIAVLLLSIRPAHADQPSAAAVAAFDAYVTAVEARMARQHSSTQDFLVLNSATRARLRQGEVLVQRLTPPNRGVVPGGLIHDWGASAFVPAAKAEDVLSLLRDYQRYPAVFSPQVAQARVLSERADDVQVALRLRQHHVLTVVLDTDYDVAFSRPDAEHVASFSRSTRIAEIASPGARGEHALSPADDHGFLWRLDTWWSAEQADGGVYLQVESVSLTRSIPTGLAWIVGPYIESVPRESLAFTLRSVCRALRP